MREAVFNGLSLEPNQYLWESMFFKWPTKQTFGTQSICTSETDCINKNNQKPLFELSAQPVEIHSY